MDTTTGAPAVPGLLVNADWLNARLEDPTIRVLDARGRHPSSPLPHAKRADYDRAHVPGAVFVDWTSDFIDPTVGVPYQLADPEKFAGDARRLGIAVDGTVVTYDDYYGLHACRVAWALRCHGVDARVLDGGWRTWTDEGRPTTETLSTPRQTAFPTSPPNSLRLTLDDLDRARERGAVIIDARPRHLYLGHPTVPGTGHIPGARTLSYQELVDGATGLFQSAGAVRRLVLAAGIDPDDPPGEVITTCGIGVSATVAMVALEMVGVPVSGVYDGAWSEWIADGTREIAYGDN
jgi:thiosulfate/3-mercaptopyruvate sulfurtransferase